MTIPDKATFARLSQRGLLGNFLRTWNYLDAAFHSNAEWFTIQSTAKQSPWFVPVVHGYKLLSTVKKLIEAGAPREEMYFREIPPPDVKRIIQFEGLLGPQWQGAGPGVELFYELDTTNPVRGIRERCQTASGLKAQALLRTYLEPRGYDTLMSLWDEYPTAIVEASEFSAPVGAFHQRLVVWEFRDF